MLQGLIRIVMGTSPSPPIAEVRHETCGVNRVRLPVTHPCHRCGVTEKTFHVNYGLWSCLACMSPEARSKFSVQSDQEQLSADEEDRVGSADATELDPSKGVHIRTIVGTFLFQKSHDVGKLGDQLTHIYYNSNDTKAKFTRHPSKRNSLHGIDAVYSYCVDDKVTKVLVIESKVNQSRLKAGQLSDDGIEERAEWLRSKGTQEQQETGELVKKALRGRKGHVLQRVLHTHDLENGYSYRIEVNGDGHVKRGTGKRRQVNKFRLERLLEQRLEKGTCKRV